MNVKKLEDLLEDMSFEEKVGQLTQVAGSLYEEDAIVTGLLNTFQISEKALGLSGSILSLTGAKKLKELQDKCMEKQPHHIPQVFMHDVINGYQTIYPIPLAQGATFQPDLVEKLAHMSAVESTAAGVHVTFSPMVDLVRDARWGRVMESTGEDPYLNGLMGAAMVKGYQGEDISEKGNVAACVKHFAGYGGAEAGREYDNVELSERTFRDEYLPGYEACVKAGAKLVMTSFNTLNRIPSTGNQWLMKKVLREEMGFQGVLISDYAAVKEMISHGFARDDKEAAGLAMKAGLDMEMMSTTYITCLKELIEDGKISMEQVDEAVMRILKLKNELGLFENPYKDADEEEEKRVILCEEHRQLARTAAVESFVLLKNEDSILPFSSESEEEIAFIGPYIDEKQIHGSWSFPENIDQFVTIKEGVCSMDQTLNATWNQGACRLDHTQKLKDTSTFIVDEAEKEKMLAEAILAAKKAKKVVLCLGEHFQQTGEAASRTNLCLGEDQLTLLKKISEVNENIVTIVFAGRPVIMDEIDKLSKAVLYAWFPGVEGGNAIADVLFGKKEPGGRLPMSFSHRVGQLPNYYSRFRTGRPNDGSFNQSFVMGYIDQEDQFMYPFGYGLSYSDFQYSKVKLNRTKMSKKDSIVATVTIKNTGKRESTETVQMYLSDLYGSVIRPGRLLKGFKKVTLKPAEETEVSFEITEPMLRFYNIDMEFVSEPGEFKVYIGRDSQTMNEADFELED